MKHCPCCKARWRGHSNCSRCQADLTQLIATESTAQTYLSHAIQSWLTDQIDVSIHALEYSIQLHKTTTALLFRRFIIQKTTRQILYLLAQQEFITAKQILYKTDYLLHYSPTLKTLNHFTEYLFLNQYKK